MIDVVCCLGIVSLQMAVCKVLMFCFFQISRITHPRNLDVHVVMLIELTAILLFRGIPHLLRPPVDDNKLQQQATELINLKILMENSLKFLFLFVELPILKS